MKTLAILELAEAEFREATQWYMDRDPRVAGRFTAEARKTLQLIETFPQIGSRVPEVPEAGVRRMPIHTFPYHVVFVDLGDRIEVVAFAHNRRNPRYFVRRLRR